MSEEASIVIRTQFERVAQSSCGLPQYESARASVAVEETFVGALNPDEVIAIVRNQFVHAKSAVLDQLGLGYEQDERGLLREAFGDVQSIASAPSAPGAARAAVAPPTAPVAHPATGTGPSAARPAAPPVRRPTPAPPAARPQSTDNDAYWAEVMDQPHLWTDTRVDKESGVVKANAPDFRSLQHKDGKFSKGLWIADAPEWFIDPFLG